MPIPFLGSPLVCLRVQASDRDGIRDAIISTLAPAASSPSPLRGRWQLSPRSASASASASPTLFLHLALTLTPLAGRPLCGPSARSFRALVRRVQCVRRVPRHAASATLSHRGRVQMTRAQLSAPPFSCPPTHSRAPAPHAPPTALLAPNPPAARASDPSRAASSDPHRVTTPTLAIPVTHRHQRAPRACAPITHSHSHPPSPVAS
ncbi:hypothetical protein HETIRDRAFT_451236 [Heterobasidion irregulare TC 32-1]|uniref:Uncharacterized protein n=1 Tax=Heterobasidion irregulare (strain TC 32-1) TaxID=747525 RepID=W4K8Q8_HETIT|nr:uncharacterized protein HETIRDRAFT_451236 [Heterobasidion irregulare TC 32-1]ETW81446.1 hypothetical protein HETIRDRAFT_451236 [Heterobasidion irregulare TC 32-1]